MKFQDDISNMNTYVRTDKPKPICPLLFQSWGHNDEPKQNSDFKLGEKARKYSKSSAAGLGCGFHTTYKLMCKIQKQIMEEYERQHRISTEKGAKLAW